MKALFLLLYVKIIIGIRKASNWTGKNHDRILKFIKK